MDRIRLRLAEPADAPFMTDMLTEAVCAVTQHDPAQMRHDPQIRGYIADWPRHGDRGFVAIDQHGTPVAACWLRYRSTADPGYGHLADDIPELTIAVRPDMRGRGIGRALLDHTVTDAQTRGVTALSLNVEHGNHAARNLYHSLGWHTVTSDAHSDTMSLNLTPNAEHTQPTTQPI